MMQASHCRRTGKSDSHSRPAVIGSGFVAANVTFRNTGGPGEDVLALNSSSSRSAFYCCSFVAIRSTIYFEEARLQFFRNCDIYGAENVISGDAIADFQNSSVYIGQSLGVDYNVATLQLRRNPLYPTGFVFDHSRILPNLGRLPALNNTFLGFAGSDYSRVVFINCFLSGIVNSAGWISNGSRATKTIYYAEFNNTGPGAATLNRVKWPGFRILDAKGAVDFSLGAFFGDTEWLWSTGVPYWEDLRGVELVPRQLF